ncbi:MAG: ATP synthase F1 subunit epsilon [Oscillospiraceae bacterium]|nr:ATP synthase F1 subunit epsilon [Oscillospiraceae bacterium]
MTTPFNLEIITPAGVFYDGETPNLIVRTTVGDKGILARHEPYIAALPIGIMRVMTEDKKFRKAAISTGTVQVKDNGDTVILVQSCEWCDEIDVERAQAAKERAEERIRDAELSDVQHAIAEFKLKRALNRLGAAE